MLVAVKQSGLALRFAAQYLRADKEVVLAALLQNPGAILHASDKIQSDTAWLCSIGRP